MMNEIYINAEWYLCTAIWWAKWVFDINSKLVALITEWTERKYKVNKDWLFEEII